MYHAHLAGALDGIEQALIAGMTEHHRQASEPAQALERPDVIDVSIVTGQRFFRLGGRRERFHRVRPEAQDVRSGDGNGAGIGVAGQGKKSSNDLP